MTCCFHCIFHCIKNNFLDLRCPSVNFLLMSIFLLGFEYFSLWFLKILSVLKIATNPPNLKHLDKIVQLCSVWFWIMFVVIFLLAFVSKFSFWVFIQLMENLHFHVIKSVADSLCDLLHKHSSYLKRLINV